MEYQQAGELDRVIRTPHAPGRRKSTIVRFLEKVDTQPDGCWEWRGRREDHGYGWFRHPDTKYAHRAAYILLVGPIPEGLTIDHLCENRGCVNPDHLEAVTTATNLARGGGRWSECDRLHPDTPTRLTRKVSGRTHCLECHRIREKNRRDRTKV